MRVPKMVKNGFNSVLQTSAVVNACVPRTNQAETIQRREPRTRLRRLSANEKGEVMPCPGFLCRDASRVYPDAVLGVLWTPYRRCFRSRGARATFTGPWAPHGEYSANSLGFNWLSLAHVPYKTQMLSGPAHFY